MHQRMRVLTISDLFPSPLRPADGIFVEHQVKHLVPYCSSTVVVPLRVFPPARLWRLLFRPGQAGAAWRDWLKEVRSVPSEAGPKGIEVQRLRYTSPPRQVLHGLWGFFAYVSLRGKLHLLDNQRHFQLIHAHYASPAGVVALLANRWMRVPVVVSVHGADVTFTARQNVLGRRVVRWVFDQADAILANSSWTKQEIVQLGGSPEKVQIVRLGAEPPEAVVAPLPEAESDGLTLLSIGYLTERKGHAYVLHALRRLLDQGHRLRYVIVGDGPRQHELQALADSLGLTDHVRFEGYKRHEDVWPYLAGCDIFVLPSWKEAFGVVYVEALSLGKPVVGCQGQGGPEDIRSLGDCIELVIPRDTQSLTAALQRLIENPVRRAEMGSIGKAIAREHFSWKRNAQATFEIYQRVVGNRDGQGEGNPQV